MRLLGGVCQGFGVLIGLPAASGLEFFAAALFGAVEIRLLGCFAAVGARLVRQPSSRVLAAVAAAKVRGR